MTRGCVGRAELLRMAASATDEELRRFAVLAGFEFDPACAPSDDVPEDRKLPGDVGASIARESSLAFKQSPPVETPFFHAAGFKMRAPELADGDARKPSSPAGYAGWRARPAEEACFRPLAPWRQLVPVLRDLLALPSPTRRIDVPRSVERIAKGDTLERLPMRARRSWPSKLVVVLDRSTHLVPFWQDQDLVAEALARFLPNAVMETVVFDDQDGSFKHAGRMLAGVRDIPAIASDVLVIGDLGALAPGGTARAAWDKLGAVIEPGGARALSPIPRNWMSARTRMLWRIGAWGATPSALSQARESADDLLSLLSPLVRVEPNLLRQVRIKAFPHSGPEVEALAWRHGAMAVRLEDAGQLRPQAMQRRRAGFGRIDETARRALVETWRAFRGDLHEAVYFEELMELDPDTRAMLPEADIEDAEAFFSMMRQQVLQGGDDCGARLWCARIGDRFLRLKDNPDALALIWHAKKDDPDFAGLDPGMVSLPDQLPETYAVTMLGDRLLIAPEGFGHGSLLGLLSSGDGLIRVDAISGDEAEAEELPRAFRDAMSDGSPGPEMIEVPAESFLMGAPEGEAERFVREGPQQEIAFAKPFALAQHPVTFEEYDLFCEATRREKPDDEGWGRGRRPVINVSWHDAQAYCDWLGEETGEPYRLPSEAEWEYACRAGTVTGYHWGDDWDAAKANGGGSEKSTTEVEHYPANPWGFHDMHGNVDEWCADLWNSSHEGAAADGSARQASEQHGETLRVLRGGSWLNGARSCRSAVRDRADPGGRGVCVGFRPARGQQGALAGRQASAERSGAGGAEAGMAELPAGRSPRSPVQRPGDGFSGTPLARLRVMPGTAAELRLPDLPAAPFVIRTDRAELVIRRITRSDLGWASGLGRDRFGLWAEIAVEDLRPRLRYCPPGRFTMGSPPDDAGYKAIMEKVEGYKGAEEPQTEVTFETGFWLFEMPVTQDLYQAVRPSGKNPSRFQSPTRPVENVSWDDAVAFVTELNGRSAGLDLHLPSEAAWEYACRAGTTAATYAGPVEILGDNNAPVLDEIAWYGGNGGVKFDLEQGEDSSDWPDKQHPHGKAGTRIVGLKRPNPWGLHDMIGNVFEWCDDAWVDSHEGASADGFARQAYQQDGETNRVLRGGSWGNVAGYCRSAVRNAGDPGDRDDFAGFRPARGQQGALASRKGSAERSGPGGAEAGEAEPTAEQDLHKPGHVSDLKDLPETLVRKHWDKLL